MRSEIWVAFLPAPPPKFGVPKISKFRRDFAQLCDLIANISGTRQDIVNRKTALYSRTGKLNLVYFCLLFCILFQDGNV